jgi:ketosteroid isomerase-like protein
VHRFADAFRAGDVARVDSLLHEKYVHTNGGSKPTSRAAWMTWFTSRSQKIATGELTVLGYDLRDVDVAIFSDVAVVTGRVDSTSKTTTGTEQSSIRFTNVWMCNAGWWKRIAFHDSPAIDVP